MSHLVMVFEFVWVHVDVNDIVDEGDSPALREIVGMDPGAEMRQRAGGGWKSQTLANSRFSAT